MQVSYKWLQDYVDIELPPQELADALTMIGVAVENVIPLGQNVQGVVTGRIESISPHPNADKLIVTEVNTGAEMLPIVTAATNVSVGDVIPVALEGAQVASGMAIKRAKLRGVESRGMMCSGAELGIDPSSLLHEQAYGIMILPPDTPLGQDAKEVTGQNDYILEMDLTPNRGDCLSIIGVAREVAAMLGKPLKVKEPEFPEIQEDIAGKVQVDIEDPAMCGRYIARLIRQVKVGPSPLWMQSRLRSAGMRPISNLVDVTNYVLLEMGQPMHAFDYDKLVQQHIIVRQATLGEEMMSLDGTLRELNPEMLVIADPSGSVAVAGVMGGLSTEVTDETTSILLESAHFNPVSIRRTSKNLGLRSEASIRFEKGIDQEGCLRAINRAAQLIYEMGAGEVVAGVVDNHIAPAPEKTILLRPFRANKILGTTIPKEEMVEILNRLQFGVQDSGEDLLVTVPSFRVDVSIEEDLIEEIARIHGFDRIPSTLSAGLSSYGAKTREQAFRTTLANTLAGSGLNEAITYSFTHPRVFDQMKLPPDNSLRQTIALLNPLSEDHSVMRTFMLPGILEALAKNYKRRNNNVALFEMGAVFIPDADGQTHQERQILVGAAMGATPGNWLEKPRTYDYYYLKGVLENLFRVIGAENVQYVPEKENPSFHPGRTATIKIGAETVGIIGELHPDVLENFELPERIVAFELDVALLWAGSGAKRQYRSLPKYPGMDRDLAIVVKKEYPVGDILKAIGEKGGELLREAAVFDVYQGAQVPEGHQSIALTLKFQAEDRTLTEGEVAQVITAINEHLSTSFQAQLRG